MRNLVRRAGASLGLISRALRVRFPARSLFSELVELSGLCAIVYGVETVNRPAGFIVGGLLAVVFAAALDRRLR